MFDMSVNITVDEIGHVHVNVNVYAENKYDEGWPRSASLPIWDLFISIHVIPTYLI